MVSLFGAFEAGGSEGMAGYDREEARRLPLPSNIPETFAYRFPPRLPLGSRLLGHNRLPERDDGIGAAYQVPDSESPFRVFLRPLYDEGDAADPIDPVRVQATWEADQKRWAAEVEEGLRGQGFEPVTPAAEAAEAEEVFTLYGRQPLHRLSWTFENA